MGHYATQLLMMSLKNNKKWNLKLIMAQWQVEYYKLDASLEFGSEILVTDFQDSKKVGEILNF